MPTGIRTNFGPNYILIVMGISFRKDYSAIEHHKNWDKCWNTIPATSTVIAATPRSAQTTKMDRPEGVFGERSPIYTLFIIQK